MVKPHGITPVLPALRERFGTRLQENVILANYTTARVGGPASALLVAHQATDLEQYARELWALGVPFVIIGSGSNVLFSDQGYPGVVIINRAKNVRINNHGEKPFAYAESGANFGALARQAALRGFSGLEWAAGIPGTVGGAVYGNAGAHGSDMTGSLLLADILHPTQGRSQWTVEQMEYAYRSSSLKRSHEGAVILAAQLRLSESSKEAVQARMDEYGERRRTTQPTGASLGSMFKNPPGDYAGRLIEASGLKGTRIGGVQISAVHANFFINDENASSSDIARLIRLAREKVAGNFGVDLELEVELLGEWEYGLAARRDP